MGLSVPAEDFRSLVAGVEGVSYLRELPSGGAVVLVESERAVRSLAGVPGVTSLREDRPEQRM
ncbi:hypothetical protein Misp01_83140 [Microtetraspora sp. NBRC 13810]|nr:hypothetical protein Misp01_83140 [Microtetraspora sp. NBRC 13810]